MQFIKGRKKEKERKERPYEKEKEKRKKNEKNRATVSNTGIGLAALSPRESIFNRLIRRINSR